MICPRLVSWPSALWLVTVLLGCSGESTTLATDGSIADIMLDARIPDGPAPDVIVALNMGDAALDEGVDGQLDITTHLDGTVTGADVMPPLDGSLLDAQVMDAAPIVDAMPLPSLGCGTPAMHDPGGTLVTIEAGLAGDGQRRFFLVIPENYDPNTAHKLIVGFAGTNWMGEDIRDYLRLEADARNDEIYVYPDVLFRDFEGWGNYGGWLLGPHAHPAHGEQDLVFIRTMVEFLKAEYCVDPDRVFATGHSWGGDMAHVAACFLGDIFAASAPVAANRPYWFEQNNGEAVNCEGDTAIWSFFGVADEHFAAAQAYPGEYGDQCRDFWLLENGCEGADANLAIDLDPDGQCMLYQGCEAETRYCLYGPASGHQIPGYFPETVMEWFRSF